MLQAQLCMRLLLCMRLVALVIKSNCLDSVSGHSPTCCFCHTTQLLSVVFVACAAIAALSSLFACNTCLPWPPVAVSCELCCICVHVCACCIYSFINAPPVRRCCHLEWPPQYFFKFSWSHKVAIANAWQRVLSHDQARYCSLAKFPRKLLPTN